MQIGAISPGYAGLADMVHSGAAALSSVRAEISAPQAAAHDSILEPSKTVSGPGSLQSFNLLSESTQRSLMQAQEAKEALQAEPVGYNPLQCDSCS